MRLGHMRFAGGLGLMILAGILAGPALGQPEAVSAPAGFHRIQLLGDSDTFVSFPFTRPAAAAGRVSAVSGNVVTLAGINPWAPNQLVYEAGVQPNTYFMLVRSGQKEGLYYPVLGNTEDNLTLDLAGDGLADLAPGDRVAVIPYWTLGTVFPGGEGVHVSTSRFLRNTEVFVPDLEGVGINLSASKTYYFMGGHWRPYPQTEVRDDDVLLPDAYVIVRHNVSASTTVTIRGAAPMGKWAMPLRAQASVKQDNFVALPRPGPMTLHESGLFENGAFKPSNSRFLRTDELFTFDNTVAGKNKSAAATYYYLGGWKRWPGTADVGNEPVLLPGMGFVIRKGDPNPVVWVNPPNY